ncbi:hypothetical protein QA646_08730 [Rhizobium sp. CB3090]|uniref:hypothetical protein n=1 Tax=Rhizobium sp. CB3090 TaxID=3039156 RepID=UPI0024B19604|nr:hypothetical protein [Rhizobium sp. CB3090]WFU10907.1 hypothetical protein QA646_08730 [Rhizobium sp. CB3090]
MSSSDISAMSDIPSPPISDDHPDRHVWCQFALSSAFSQVAAAAAAAGWKEREIAAALVDLADNHMLGLIAAGEFENLLSAIKKRS